MAKEAPPPGELAEEAETPSKQRLEQKVNEDEFVSLRPSGELGISSKAMDQFFEDVEEVEIHFEKEKQVIMLRPVKDSQISYSVIRDDYGGRISAKRFLELADLLPDKPVRCATVNAGSYIFIHTRIRF